MKIIKTRNIQFNVHADIDNPGYHYAVWSHGRVIARFDTEEDADEYVYDHLPAPPHGSLYGESCGDRM